MGCVVLMGPEFVFICIYGFIRNRLGSIMHIFMGTFKCTFFPLPPPPLPLHFRNEKKLENCLSQQMDRNRHLPSPSRKRPQRHSSQVKA